MRASNARNPAVRRPVIAAVATLIGAAAIAGYSSFYLSSAYYAYSKCNPPPAGTTCTGSGFWGFGPTLFLASDLAGLAIAVLLAVLAFLLMTRPERHVILGTVIVVASAASLISFGGAIIGAAAGIVGGVIALVYRTSPYRGLAQWVAGPAPAPPAARSRPEALPKGLDLDERPETLPEPLARPAPPPSEPTAPVPPAPAETESHPFGSLSTALGSKATPPPASTAPSPARTVSTLIPMPEPRRPLIPYAGPTGSPPPALPTKPPASPPARGPIAPPPAPPPATAPSPGPEAVSSVGPMPVRKAWKCPRCGLTNAPWSRTCTQCKAAQPPP